MSYVKTRGSLPYRLRHYLESVKVWEKKRGAIWNTSSCIKALQVWLLLSCIVCYTANTSEELIPAPWQMPVFSAIVITLTLINYVLLEEKSPWRKSPKKNDACPATKNSMGKALGWLFVLLLAVNLSFSYFLLHSFGWAY